MILITGATGFVGGHLLSALSEKKVSVLGRKEPRGCIHIMHHALPLDERTDFSEAVQDIRCIIHCAARVHVMDDKSSNAIDAYRDVNTKATVKLAKQAAKAGVSRFIFVSSIKSNGESTSLNHPFSHSSACLPEDDYGRSKAEAEQQLIELGRETGIEIVIIRPTLVYGPSVKANFATLLHLVSIGIPLPFGCITNNRRSLVSVTNLVDLIVTCIDHPKAANQTFLVSDDNDVSTSEMVKQMARALGKPTWQLPVPVWCYKLAGKVFNKSDVVDRLTGSLQVDISHTKETLDWVPTQSLQEGFKQTADAFLQSKKSSGKA